MIIKYYNNPELSYANRKRYNTFSFIPFYQEEQKKVLFGDGASTSIKTSVENICKYVTIDNTRWYVTSYIYLNGGQVRLNLQRDVIGEFGIGECFGKIERGYTDNFLKYRKELSLNQILKERKSLIPPYNTYGNYTVNTHENEKWGILYLTKPTEIDPSTGEPYPEQVNINIPAFAPKTVNYPPLNNNYSSVSNLVSSCQLSFNFTIRSNTGSQYNIVSYLAIIKFNLNSSNEFNYSSTAILDYTNEPLFGIDVSGKNTLKSDEEKAIAKFVVDKFAQLLLNKSNDEQSKYLKLPSGFPEQDLEVSKYNNVVISENNKFYKYNLNINNFKFYGSNGNGDWYFNYLFNLNNNSVNYGDKTFDISVINPKSGFDLIQISNYVDCEKSTITKTELSNVESGTLVLDVSKQLVDEPFVIYVFPLYNVKIGNYNIESSQAFMIFNTVIQYLSGENPYLVDAQIYPYCPTLTNVASEIAGYPFFGINSSSYTHICEVQLMADMDIKKEYIERQYSIISPDFSGKFSFNFYDYINTFEPLNGKNSRKMYVAIKTALKPFSILSTAVIQSEIGSLAGIRYGTDLDGSVCSSAGFECTLSSNQYQQYLRQNSNYEKFFNLDQQELMKQHEVEKVNENVQAVTNTISAVSFGAIAGGSIADTGIGSAFGTKAFGASVGATLAGVAVGTAMYYQNKSNNELREMEERLQKERYDLTIGTVKNLPNSINRISSFNEIIMADFWYHINIYECTDEEKTIVDNFIRNYSYSIGIYDYIINYYSEGWFIKAEVITSNYSVNLHEIARKELAGGIYYYE